MPVVKPVIFSTALSILALSGASGATPPVVPVSSTPVTFGDVPAPPVPPGTLPLRPPVKNAAAEQWEQRGPAGPAVRNVVDPTLTPVLPEKGKATGVAVIVAPGGAFRMLSIENEGFGVAHYLAAQGITAFVLKYRTVPVPRDRTGYYHALGQIMAGTPDQSKPLLATPEAVEDGQAAVRLVRSQAARWGVDPAKIGFIGFSAGAMTALEVGLGSDAAALWKEAFIAWLKDRKILP